MIREKDLIQVAVAGLGGWGKNLARNYHQIPDCNLRRICDTNDKAVQAMAAQVPGTPTTTRFEDLLEDRELQAIVVATPAPTHFALGKAALLAGKDVFIEKPFTLEVAHSEELIRIAEGEGRILMVGHLLKYHPVINRLKQMVDSGDLGDIFYMYNQRVNLGTVRQDENALWNFAPHDISSILYLIGREPTDVAARGQSYLKRGVEDVVFITLNFGDRTMAHIHVSWLDPHKVRKMTIVGSRKMAVFDDIDSNEKLRIYDKGATYNSDYNSFAEYVALRSGDILIPNIKVGEPLRIECNHFLDCVRGRSQPLSDGRDGLRIVKVLDAAQRSLRENGVPIPLTSSAS